LNQTQFTVRAPPCRTLRRTSPLPSTPSSALHTLPPTLARARLCWPRNRCHSKRSHVRQLTPRVPPHLALPTRAHRPSPSFSRPSPSAPPPQRTLGRDNVGRPHIALLLVPLARPLHSAAKRSTTALCRHELSTESAGGRRFSCKSLRAL
jgi:hypothetical protein